MIRLILFMSCAITAIAVIGVSICGAFHYGSVANGILTLISVSVGGFILAVLIVAVINVVFDDMRFSQWVVVSNPRISQHYYSDNELPPHIQIGILSGMWIAIGTMGLSMI